ncbi:MAG: DUF1285 domain-containing protein [Candidatus Tectomicrobia bacterium]|uniref:DUF1285 domain-containing protein n=1 Tax=Tectimicrobiota bacterium TaxID=2528274 RepID=A0A932GPQ7_UNCTE|nr:DUF1285 domain-containing protein [Candidatus Tectomicrobia bacterium]
MKETPPGDGWPLFIDAQGNWYEGPEEISHPRIRRYLYDHLTFDPDRGFVVRSNRESRTVEVEDVPFMVLRTTPRRDPQGLHLFYSLILSDESEEILDLRALHWGGGNTLYCHIKRRAFRARFSRPAYLQLLWNLEEDYESGRFYLPAGNDKHYL